MLTYIQINAAKPRAKAWNLSDSQNLYLVIQPNGSKLWRFNYRFLDKQKKLHLGGWPTISLAEARVRRDEAKKKIAEGIDPALEKKRARIAAKYAAANTFQAVAEEWLIKCERDGLAPVTVEKIRWLLAKAYPLIGTIPIAQITPHEALAVLRKVEATGAYESARRMRSVLSRVFRYGVATVRCDKDVAADLRGAIAVPKVAVASMLGLSIQSDDPTPGVIAYLRDKRILLILDTCEHLIEAVAALAARVFAAAPRPYSRNEPRGARGQGRACPQAGSAGLPAGRCRGDGSGRP
ncbi:integrase arm-type DNA-binding domain-containing protein [Sphingomonas sp. CL5.1]|uniref:tyrosine-type recombinase/integrase n=1 Tax=Sphingomonas sp. CL5.1 TaxID=2653203 RepID=UPI0020C62607|nr:integrase arm-type DNA-binding domain-containing protein [Sphingomonas sp. CL5.1]